ncbi:hypothetical protein ACMT1E_01730 [Sphingomonas flavalba]|uniref:hypothetical protein n=1 Tax=Sphingomonas flavalba TaxID=2559804 RepID=UPI0039E1C37B
MKHTLPLAAVAALLTLAACDSKPEVLDTNPDPMATELANAPPVELPPSVKSSVSYRCKDNRVVYVDFMSDDKSANLRLQRTDLPAHVTAETEGEAMSGNGWSISGTGETVNIGINGDAPQSCKS